ncbi:hypothetical protein [Bizionia argentinensis]|uniref:hypothetical protein n=1 Tax=Bizionia argentinensis TaxID=456455 RepID=UPI000222FF7D|nr:hypothetical protein [Bizionia argentinensis]
MRTVNSISNVVAYKIIPELLIIGSNSFQSNNQNYNYFILSESDACKVKVLKNYVFLQFEEFGKIIILTEKGKFIKTIDEGFNLYFSIKTDNKLIIRNRITKSYWFIFDDLQFEESTLSFRFNYYINNLFFFKIYNTLEKVSPQPSWLIDFSEFGIHKNFNDEIIPNDLDGDLMGFEDSLYVPLQGGQLLCLDINTGQKKWIKDYNGRSGFYSLNNDKIYKHDGLSLLEIDAKTGLALRSKIFSESDEAEVQSFYSLNGFWTYEDVIILYGLDNTVVMLNKHNFSLFGFISLPAPISTDKNNVTWDKNKLYVLDLSNTLHIFENEKLPN